MPVYFQYPWCGNIYAVDVDEGEFRSGRLVILPDGNLLNMTVKEGYYPVVGEAEISQEDPVPARIAIAAEEGFQRKFEGDWEPLIKLINIASEVNTLFSVILTKEEYTRLEEGGLEEMKEKFSERAFSLLSLQEDYVEENTPSLELWRTCHCCH